MLDGYSDGSNDDDTLNSLLDVGTDAEEHQRVIDNRNDQRADQCIDDAALAAGKTRSADGDRCNAGEDQIRTDADLAAS